MICRLLTMAGAGMFLVSSALAETPGPEAIDRIHDKTLIIDSHIDIPVDYASAKVDIGGFTSHQVDLPKMRIGGMDGGIFIIYAPQGPLTSEDYAKARETAEARYAAIQRLTRAYPGEISFARTAKEARRLHKQGKRIAFMGMENAYPLGEDLSDLQTWIDRGLVYVGMVHFGNNQFADSSNIRKSLGDVEDQNGGLTPMGRELVAALNKAGVMVDVSHASRKAMMQMVELSAAPVIASHSSVTAIEDNLRNLDDEQLRAIAASGGVAQMVAFDTYLKKPPEEWTAFLRAEVARLGYENVNALYTAKGPNAAADIAAYQAKVREANARFDVADVSDFVDHVDHAVSVIGIDHVGLSSDFGGGGGVVGWRDASETRAVTAELMRRGYDEDDIAKLWGGNLLRVMEDVQKIGRRL